MSSAWEVARPVCATKGKSWGSRTAVAGLLHLAQPLGTREPRPRCAGTHSGSGIPADSCQCSAGRVNSGEERRRGLAFSPCTHPTAIPVAPRDLRTSPCPPASLHYLGSDQGQRLSRRRALGGGDTRETRTCLAERRGENTRPASRASLKAQKCSTAAEGLSAWTSALVRGNRLGRDSPHPSGVGTRRSAPPRLQLLAR